MRTVATGWWCTNCEFFENEDDVDTRADTCVGCGCDGSDHHVAEVVTKEYGA